MGGNKTIDGLSIDDVANALSGVPGIIVRPAKKHPFVAIIPGEQKSCPIATSTVVKTMVVPQIARYTGQRSQAVYSALRRGESPAYMR